MIFEHSENPSGYTKICATDYLISLEQREGVLVTDISFLLVTSTSTSPGLTIGLDRCDKDPVSMYPFITLLMNRAGIKPNIICEQLSERRLGAHSQRPSDGPTSNQSRLQKPLTSETSCALLYHTRDGRPKAVAKVSYAQHGTQSP